MTTDEGKRAAAAERLRARNEQLVAQNDGLEREARELRPLRKLLAGAQAEIATLRESVADAGRRREAAETRAQSLDGEVARLQAKVGTLQAVVDQVKDHERGTKALDAALGSV